MFAKCLRGVILFSVCCENFIFTISDLECGVPADIPNGRLVYLNDTLNARRFKSQIEYECDVGFVAVGRTELMCDVDERWNGPPPRCDPVTFLVQTCFGFRSWGLFKL